MITDNRTNFLYLADTLPSNYPDFYKRFQNLLQASNVKNDLLPNTKDIWAVDYMPAQVAINKFVRFVYNPNYLKSKKYQKTISDVDSICTSIGIETIKTDIILDGGNITRWKNKVIMTDRVFIDNPQYERKHLIKQLYDLLEVDNLYFIPEQPNDYTGHSDGMIRFVDEHIVIVNDYKREKQWFQRALILLSIMQDLKALKFRTACMIIKVTTRPMATILTF